MYGGNDADAPDIFPSEIIGTVGAMIIYVALNTLLVQAFPSGFAGVAGSFVQVLFQVGGTIGNAALAGFLRSPSPSKTSTDGDVNANPLEDWTRSRNGFIFISCVMAASGAAFALLWRQDKVAGTEASGAGDETAAAEATREAGRDVEARVRK